MDWPIERTDGVKITLKQCSEEKLPDEDEKKMILEGDS